MSRWYQPKLDTVAEDSRIALHAFLKQHAAKKQQARRDNDAAVQLGVPLVIPAHLTRGGLNVVAIVVYK